MEVGLKVHTRERGCALITSFSGMCQPLANILSTHVINAPSHIILDLSGMLADELM